MSKKKAFSFKKDKYRSARGGYSRLLNIHCRKCNNLVAVYQKDGPGVLERLYIDRVFEPDELVNLQNSDIEGIQPLKCSKCNVVLGTPYIYEKENRKAFRLYEYSVLKKVRKLIA